MIGSLGAPATVAAAGTPVQVTDFYTGMFKTPAEPHLALHGIMFQTRPTNTGLIYVGKANMVKATLANVLAVLAVPTANFIPTFSVALTLAPNALRLEDFWIDADVSGDGVLVTYLQL